MDFRRFTYAPPQTLARIPRVRERVSAVRTYPQKSKRSSTLKLAETPSTLWQVNVIPTSPFLVVREVSSGNRQGICADSVASNRQSSPVLRFAFCENSTLVDFAILTSAMHMAWLRHVGGRLESRPRYSIGLVYHKFPMFNEEADVRNLNPLALAVLDARAAHPLATLADLYDPDLMPPDLRKVHQALDRAVDRLYRPRRFASERERVEHLFVLYERMCSLIESEKPMIILVVRGGGMM